MIEIFNTPLPINWSRADNNDWEGSFNVNGKQYIIKMMNEPMMGWEVKFELLQNGKYTQEITGTGDAPTVFSTVLAGIQQWLNKMKPSSFAITAREPSRKRLYARMLQMLPKNWEVEDMNGTFFVRDVNAMEPAYSGFGDDEFEDYYDDDY